MVKSQVVEQPAHLTYINMIVICGSECTGLVKKCELLLPIKGRKKKNIKKKKKKKRKPSKEKYKGSSD